MRGISIVSVVLFTGCGIIMGYLYARLTHLETLVADRCLDIERLGEMSESTEKMMESIKEDNRKMIDWIREDSRANWSRVEKSLAEIRSRLYGRD